MNSHSKELDHLADVTSSSISLGYSNGARHEAVRNLSANLSIHAAAYLGLELVLDQFLDPNVILGAKYSLIATGLTTSMYLALRANYPRRVLRSVRRKSRNLDK